MALIVEDGSNVAGAESYISVSAADTYFSNRGNAAWAALTTAKKEESLREATGYMSGAYRKRWKGLRFKSAQALDWPRANVDVEDEPYGNLVATNVVPTEVKNACAELASRASTAKLLADQTQRKSSVSVGPISTSYEAGSKLSITYAAIDALLRPLLKSGSGQINLIRT